MLRNISVLFGFAVIGFLVYVQTRPAEFKYVRSAVIQATPEKIFPYLSQFKRANAWLPYNKKDPHTKYTYSGATEGVGQIMEFAGNPEVGKGRLEMLKVVSNSLVEIKLTMLEPIQGENIIQYLLTPEAPSETRFKWTLTGSGGFISKLMGVLIDCEKMVAADFEKGIQDLKILVNSAAAPR